MHLLGQLSLLSALFSAPAPKSVEPQIVEAALYKNGLSAIVRSVDIPANSEVMLGSVRPSIGGTFWISGQNGLVLDSIVNTTVKGKVQVAASNIGQLITLNVGKNVTLKTRHGEFTGTLVAANGSTAQDPRNMSGMTLLKTDKGTMALNMSDIEFAIFPDGPNSTFETETTSRGVVVKSKAGGKMLIYSVESGLTWLPMYRIELINKDTLKLTMRTSVVNELGNLNGANVGFVAGVPNLANTSSMDPFTLLDVAQFNDDVRFRREGGSRGAMQNVAAPGAFGGGGFDAAFDENLNQGVSAGELYFYKKSGVNLKLGDKGYFNLLEGTMKYSTLYRMELPEESPNEVIPSWQTLRFKNTTSTPFTSGIASVYSANQLLLGQDQLTYSAAGVDADLRIARANDVAGVLTVTEASRKMIQVRRSSNDFVDRPLVNRKGIVALINLKKEAVKLEVKTSLQGKVLTASNDAKITTQTILSDPYNVSSSITWTLDLKPGEKIEISYDYERLLP
jgi:hypothetical protein